MYSTFTADLEKAIEDSPFVQRLAERADQDPSGMLVGQKEFLDSWRYETGGIHPLRVSFVQTAFDHVQGLEQAWVSGCMSQLSSTATSSGELRAVTAYECCLQGQTTLQCTETGYWYDTFAEQFWGRITTDAGDQRRHNQSKFDSYLTKFEQKQPTCVQFDSRLQSYVRVVQDAQGSTAVHMAASMGQESVLGVLLEAGRDRAVP